MFGFSKKKKPANALDEFIFAVYGNPPPPKRANIDHAAELACNELLLGMVDREAVREHARALAAGPIPYSTQDLAISVALNFFKDPRYVPHLFTAQLAARVQAVAWTQAGLVVKPLMQGFEDSLYKLYKPAPRARAAAPAPPTRKPIPAPQDQRYDLVRKLIHHRLSTNVVPGVPIPSVQQLQRDVPIELLKQTSEFTVLYITEQYYGVRDRYDEASAVQTLNELHSDYLSVTGFSLPRVTPPFTLGRYVRHYLDYVVSSGEEISDQFIGDALIIIDDFYGRWDDDKRPMCF